MAFDSNDLRDSEHMVVQRTCEGLEADFSNVASGEPIRAGFLRKLLLQLEPQWLVRAPGVRIRGARIEGVLDLKDCAGAGDDGLPALELLDCEIAEPINVSHARLARLSLRKSRFVGLLGHGCVIQGAIDLSNTGPKEGAQESWVSLRGARVGGDVIARGAHLVMSAASDERVRPFAALDLEGAVIDGAVLLDRTKKNVFRAWGAVRLVSAKIGGSVICTGGEFRHHGADKSREAIAAANAEIGGDFVLTGQLTPASDSEPARGTRLTGLVSLRGAGVGHYLDLRGVEIIAGANGHAGDAALDGVNLRVNGAALLQGANIKGEALLNDARFAGALSFGGGRFINPGKWAIRARNVRVGGNVSFALDETGFAPHGAKTVIEGGAQLDHAQVEGSLGWNNVEIRGPGPEGAKVAIFSLANANIRGSLDAGGLTAHQESRIDLSGLTCGTLSDDLKNGWGGDRTHFDLHGLSFAHLDNSDENWRARAQWLKRAVRFSPQPYTAVARAYARMGRREDARRIQLRQHDQRTMRASAGPLSWVLSSLFGLVAGYGFAPMRVVRALALFLAIGVFGALAMNAQGALVTPAGRQCNGAVEPALYAIDVALPFVDLGQEGACGPGRTARAELPQGVALGESEWRVFEGVAMWRWAHALYAILGAILAALAVLTFSGVMKPRED